LVDWTRNGKKQSANLVKTLRIFINNWGDKQKFAKGGVINKGDRIVKVWETRKSVYQVYTKEGNDGRENLLSDKFNKEGAEAFAKKIIAKSPKAYPKGMSHYLGVEELQTVELDYGIGGL